MSRFSKELYTDGEKLMAELPPDVNPAAVIAPCHNRKAGRVAANNYHTPN